MLKMGPAGMSQAAMNDFKHACAVSISLAFFLLFVFVVWDPILQDRFAPSSAVHDEAPQGGRDWSQSSHVEAVKFRKLIHDIRAMTEVASEGVSYELTTAEKEEWRRQNPCRSRSELLPMYDLRKNVKKLEGNPFLDSVLDEYSKLHRACTQKLGSNLSDFFVRNATVPGCKFVLGSPMYGTGLGNKLIVTISAFVYAILTQRILLVPLRTHLPKFMCEPFVGSSWLLDTETFPMPDGKKGALPWLGPVPKSKEWAEDVAFLHAMDGWVEEEQKSRGSNITDFAGLQLPSLTYALSVTIRWQPTDRFYCSAEQFMVSQVPWLYWGGCIYSVPKIFGSPLFGGTLRELFPDRMVMARLLRKVLLPGDVVFGKMLEVNSQYFRPGDRRIGIQLRNRQGEEYFERMSAELNRRILDCVLVNDILPSTSSTSSTEGEPLPTSSASTKIFIASLYSGLFDYLNQSYIAIPTATGEVVELVQVSIREEQQLGVEEDIQALVEILLLSLSDQLLVTPSSTFGSIAQGYGAITPWFIDTRENTPTQIYGSCERAQSIDICHQFTEVTYECPHDPPTETKIILDHEPGLKRCLNIDHDSGVQLISTFQSD